MAPGILVIGIGNEWRGDDAAGLLVARQIGDCGFRGTEVILLPGEGVALMDTWTSSDADLVFFVDAVSSGGQPGTIYRFEVNDAPIPAAFFNYSTHTFSLAEAIELARVLGQLPPRSVIYGIEGQQYNSGIDISAAIQTAIPGVVNRLANEIKDYLGNA